MDLNRASTDHVPLKLIDDLIDAGWNVLTGGFNDTAYEKWREKAHGCLETLLGPEHYYTVSLNTRVTKSRETNLLAGTGILTAARDLICRERVEPVAADVKHERVRQREANSRLGSRVMREGRGMFRSLLNVTDKDVAEIEIMAADKEEVATIVKRVLERKKVDSVNDLDGLTLKNLIGFLHTL